MPGTTLTAAPPSIKQVWGPWATAGLGLAAIVVFFIVQTVVIIIYVIASYINSADIDLSQLTQQLLNDGNLLSAATIASAAVCAGLILIFVKARQGASMAEYLALKKITKKTVAVMVAITIGFLAVSAGISYILDRPVDSDYVSGAYSNASLPVVFWLAMVVFAPVFEEIFLRGFLFTGFRQSRLGPAGAILLTALIWALLHYQYNYFEITIIFVLGIVLGIARYKTGSLWSPLIIHGFNNLIAMVMMSLA